MYGRPNLDFIDNLYLTKKGRGKGTTYESGARVAMAIKGPGIAAKGTSDEPVHVVDLFATILDLAGLEAPAEVPDSDGNGRVALDAVSLAPVLFDAAAALRDPNEGYLLTETMNLMTNSSRHVGARNATHKLVCVNDAGDCEFYDLGADPLEEYPLAKPASCADYESGKWRPANREWHYCRLLDIVATQSFL
jgi:arylsulfatase A-like enzyme